MSIRPGVRLGDRYQLLTLIATGGMGQVWRAEDTTLHRVVAAKVLRSEFTGDATFLARFRAEAQNTAALSHPNIASVYDYGETVQDSERLAYLVMELVEGEPLVEILHRERRLSPARTLDYLQQAATGLDAAHRAGMVHRDIKPGNLIIRPDGVLKITDFGIARAANNVPLTDNGTVVGTAQYLAPEQAEGRPAIPASDVYALGVVGYECLAGFRPFDGDNSVAIALSQIRDTPRPLPMDISPQIRDLVGRAMAKNPRVRFVNGGAFAAGIGVVRSGGMLQAPGGGPSVGPGVGPGGGPGLAPSSATMTAQPGLNPPSQSIPGGQIPPNRQPYVAPPHTGAPPQPGQHQHPGLQQHPGQQPLGTGQVPPHGAMGGRPVTGMAQPGVAMGGQPATGMPQLGTGQQPSPPAQRTRTWLIIGAAVVVVALIAVIIALIVNSGDDSNNLGGSPQGTPAPQQTNQPAAAQTDKQSSQPGSQSEADSDPSQYEPGNAQPDKLKPGQVVPIDVEPIIGAPADAVIKGLQALGLVVAEVKQDGTGAAQGTVSDVQPNTGLQLGDEVVVHVVPITDGTPFNRSGGAQAFVAQSGELTAHPLGLRNIA